MSTRRKVTPTDAVDPAVALLRELITLQREATQHLAAIRQSLEPQTAKAADERLHTTIDIANS